MLELVESAEQVPGPSQKSRTLSAAWSGQAEVRPQKLLWSQASFGLVACGTLSCLAAPLHCVLTSVLVSSWGCMLT